MHIFGYAYIPLIANRSECLKDSFLGHPNFSKKKSVQLTKLKCKK